MGEIRSLCLWLVGKSVAMTVSADGQVIILCQPSITGVIKIYRCGTGINGNLSTYYGQKGCLVALSSAEEN